LVIIDEAHHATKDSTWGKILAHNASAKLLGVTATPCRLDGKGLGLASGGFFDDLVIGPSAADLVERGRLCAPVVYAPDKSLDLGSVKKRGGDYIASQLAQVVDKKVITGNAVAHYQKYCGGAPAIAFTVSVVHAQHVVDDFKAAGFSAAVLTGSTPDKERAQMIRDLGNGKLNVLASCNVVSEGTDIPSVAAAILLRPTASYALAMQQIGRALRMMDGKEKAIILDHAGNTLRHGLPTDEVEWSLAGVKRKKGGAVLVKHCYECAGLVSVMAKRCPGCGHVFAAPDADEQAPTQGVLEREGDLVEMTPEKLRAFRRKRYSEERKAASVEQLAKIGRSRGYKFPVQWAAKRFTELHPQ
jgi:superfamily II DNA or RNA helicase